MWKRLIVASMIVCLSLFIGGCGDDEPENLDDAMKEAKELSEEAGDAFK